MKKIPAIFLILFSLNSYSQNDSIYKNHLSVNLFQLVANAEAGIYYDRVLSNRFSFSAYYGHHFRDHQVEVDENMVGVDFYTNIQKADIVNIGIKRYHFNKRDHPIALHYTMFNLCYRNTYKSAGYSDSKNSSGDYYSNSGNYYGVSISAGHEFLRKNQMFFELSISLGCYYGILNTYTTYGAAEVEILGPSGVYNGRITQEKNIRKTSILTYPIVNLKINPGFRF